MAMTTAQREFSSALRDLSDSHGAVAQIEVAKDRLTYSLESRAKAVDALLHEVKGDLLRLWVPLIAGATLLIGLFGGMGLGSKEFLRSKPSNARVKRAPFHRAQCRSCAGCHERLP